jgi:diguanylate cyclase (GGDEF)-like protein
VKQSAQSTGIDTTPSPEIQGLLAMAVYQASPEGIFVINAAGQLVTHNRQFCDLWKLSFSQVQEMSGTEVLDSPESPLLAQLLKKVEDPNAYLARLRQLKEQSQLDEHCEIALKDGRTLEQHSSALRSEGGLILGRAWFFRDITLQKQSEFTLNDMLRHDPLTGTANRRYFFERSQQEFARALRYQTPLSIASIDVDHLKETNERYGQEAGDEVLKSLCSYSQSLLRETELFARIGGKEFAILMPNTSLNGALHLAERLRRFTANSKLSFQNHEIDLNISIGVTKLREGDESIEDCLRRAEEALLKAKQNGRNRVESAA